MSLLVRSARCIHIDGQVSAEIHMGDGTTLKGGVAALSHAAGISVEAAPVLRPIRRQFMSRAISRMLHSVLLLGAVTLSYLVISNYFLQSVRVTGVSMQPTLRDSQHCFLNKWIYLFRSPARGEVIVIRDPQDNGLAVKRVIGIRGDVVRIQDGKVFLNERVLAEPYVQQTPTFPIGSQKSQTLRCRDGEVVVLGDNRLNSTDSRNYGSVPKKNVLGLIIQ